MVKGDGEILEEIVSKARHKEINKVSCIRGITRTQSNIYDGTILRKYLAAKKPTIFTKSSIVDVWLVSKYTSDILDPVNHLRIFQLGNIDEVIESLV